MTKVFLYFIFKYFCNYSIYDLELFMMMNVSELASYIDHTILKPNSSYKDVEKLCQEAIQFNFASVCILPHYVSYASNILGNTKVKTCSVVGFPLGANLISTKLEETESLIENGCEEIDMVISVASVINEDYNYVQEEIEAITELTHCNDGLVKVIVETCLLNDFQKIKMCEIVSKAGADFIKTSTGFSTSGAEINDILLFKKHLSPNIKIKASGGIKNLEQALNFINVGVNRLGTSSGKSIIDELKNL